MERDQPRGAGVGLQGLAGCGKARGHRVVRGEPGCDYRCTRTLRPGRDRVGAEGLPYRDRLITEGSSSASADCRLYCLLPSVRARGIEILGYGRAGRGAHTRARVAFALAWKIVVARSEAAGRGTGVAATSRSL